MSGLAHETAAIFECGGEALVGILTRTAQETDCGVLLLVGGPQYRVGSHRQFVLLARRLAQAGFPVMRFDYRGMGDSAGGARDFAAVGDDVAAAIDCFQRDCPTVRKVVLWGLCDAASAALLYCQARKDARVAGLCLLNPWVRSAESLAKTQVKHYYGRRLMEKAFWLKLITGRLPVRAALAELAGKLLLATRRQPAAVSNAPYQQRMAQGLREFSGPVLLILSGDDYTAKEFLERARSDPPWRGLLQQPNLQRADIPDADHTFSAARHRGRVEEIVVQWLSSALAAVRP